MCFRKRRPRASETLCRRGGVFVTSFRLGVKTESSQIVRTPLPGLLRDVMGVTVEDYVPIYSAKQGVKFASAFAGTDGECGSVGGYPSTRGSRSCRLIYGWRARRQGCRHHQHLWQR